jgi:hypothetical protein
MENIISYSLENIQRYGMISNCHWENIEQCGEKDLDSGWTDAAAGCDETASH